MFKTPYETMSARFYKTEEIITSIKEASIAGELIFPKTLDGQELVNVKGITSESENIPSFPHPLNVSLSMGDVLVVDLRPFIRSERDGSVRVTNPMDYKFLLMRTLLQEKWMEDNQQLFSLGDFPVLIYSRWIGGAINSKLGLSPDEQVVVNVITQMFYFSLFMEETFSDADKMNLVRIVSRTTFVPADKVYEIVEDLNLITDLQSFIDILKEKVNSPRIDTLNTGLLISMLSNAWFGFNAKEMISASVEYPPVFLAMIQMALESRSYRKSQLGELVYRNDKRGMGGDYTKSLYHLIKIK